jgi:TolB-like protein
MKRIILCVLVFMLTSGVVITGQSQEKKKVAVVPTVGAVSDEIKGAVQDALEEGITKSKYYTLVGRETNYEQTLREFEFQETGAVDDNQLKEFGQALSADFVCYANMRKVGANYRISYKMVEVTTIEVPQAGSKSTKNGEIDLLNVINSIAEEMFGSEYSKQSRQEAIEKLALMIHIPDKSEYMSPAVKENLYNKVARIISKNGIHADATHSRFVLAVNVIMNDKNITSGSPPQHAYKLDVSFYIIDVMDGKAFASYTSSVSGIGTNETKAYINALKNINVNNPEYQKFLETGKAKIVDFINSECDHIIVEAKSLAKMAQYGKALWQLINVPSFCSCYNQCMKLAEEIFQQKVDIECRTALLEATGIWNAEQNWDAAGRAGKVLLQIDPHSSCYFEAVTLSEKIAQRLKEIDKREWDLFTEISGKKLDLQKDLIEAYRDVAVAAYDYPEILIQYGY